MIYIQMNEKIDPVNSAAGFVVKVDGKEVPFGSLVVSTGTGVYGPAAGVTSLIKIQVNGKKVMAGDSIDIGAAVIFDDNDGNASKAINTSVQYKVGSVGTFTY